MIKMMSRLLATAALVAALLAAVAVSGGAARLQARPGGSILARTLAAVRIAGVTCTVGLRGIIRTEAIEKVLGETIGRIEEVIIPCEGALTSALSLPWPMTFVSILGTLPSAMTGLLVRLEGVSILSTGSFFECLYRGDVGLLIPFVGTNPYTNGLATPLTNSLAKVFGNFFACPSTISLEGTYSLTTQTITRI